MLKKLLKGCLTIAMVSALAIPAMADAKVSGRTIAELVQASVKDGASTMDMQSEGRIGISASAEEGDWKVGGLAQLRARNYKASVFDNLYNYVYIGNESFKATLGKQWWGLCYAGGTWYGNWVDRNCYGLTVSGGRDDMLQISLPNVGLDLMLAMNVEDDADTTGDGVKVTKFGASFAKDFGPVGLTVQLGSKSQVADEKLDADVKDTAVDGAVASETLVAVTYGLSDTLSLNFHYEAVSETSGLAGAEAVASSMLGLGADVTLMENGGLMFAYDMGSDEGTGGKDDPLKTTLLTLNFAKKIGGVRYFAGYNANTEKNDTVDSSGSTISIGGRVDF